jgi:TRAP-type C4-dicarboxylate transport system substrate-binding protein
MRQNKKFGAIVISFFLIILFGFGHQNASAQEKFVLKYSTADIEASGGQKNAVLPALKRIEQRSNGRITFQMAFAGSLLKAAEEYEGLINGVADFGRTMLYTKSNLYQIASLGMLPYAAKDPVNIYKAITELINKGYAKNDLKGLHFFGSTGTPTYAFLFRDKQPMTLKEMAGIKVRNPGGYQGESLKALGMTPVGLTPTEIYDAFSKNTVEAVYWMRDSMVAYKVYELGKYVLNFDANVFSTVVLLMNEKTWNSLPEDLQAICAEEIMTIQAGNPRAFAAGDVMAIEKMKKAGITIYSWPQAEVDKARAAVLPIWDMAIEDMNKRGMPGQQIMIDYVAALNKLGENPPWMK